MSDKQTAAPESTALRVALWRALHLQVDAAPFVFEDEVGLELAAPEAGWRDRPDMHPQYTKIFRASILARARFIEDLMIERAGQGLGQYVLLGAGLDSFAQRRTHVASGLKVFEVDTPGPQAWKRQRLIDLGYGIPDWLKFVPVNFEAGLSWWEELKAAGFDVAKPSVIASTGVSMYLTQEAILATLRQVASLAAGSTLVMSYLLPLDQVEGEERIGYEMAIKGAKASGTPFISFFSPAQMWDLAREAGFKQVKTVSGPQLAERYFANREDGLRPGSEELLVATT